MRNQKDPHQSTHNIPILTKRKQVFGLFCKCIKSKKTEIPYLHMYSESVLLYCFLEIELRCILFPLIILEMFLQLDWSPPVVNLIDST
jgi:hypothetical protein